MLLPLGLASVAFGQWPAPGPSRGRPFFMPDEQRREILERVRTQPWARDAYEALKQAARGKRPGDPTDGYAAAFLYALEGDPADALTAQKWLVSVRGKPGIHRLRLDDPNYWKGGQDMGVSEIHYGYDPKLYVSFDWAYTGMTEDARQAVYAGLLDETRFRMKWLDTWRYSPNLEFKPLYMAAFGGLALQDPGALKYLLGRVERHGSYFSMIDRILVDGQVWDEAASYALCHTDLWCMGVLSYYGQLATGRNWFTARGPNGASPRGLMDYYVDTAYPIETDAVGKRMIRLVTYGDGATHRGGDLYLVDQVDPKKEHFYRLNAHKALIACYRASGRDPAYAAFISMIPGYTPDLWDNPPLPDTNSLALPPAPSKLWPTFGLAMLRSIETPDYWTDPKAIAVCQMMSRNYGHGHADKFEIMLHGAGRLLYPDFNAIQYEGPTIGWTTHTVCHSTLMVDEEDTAAAPFAVRHEFTPEVKFLATSAEGVFDGVAQTRALLLTDRYLLDLFAASSKYPRVYDYLLHSMGQPQPVTRGFHARVTASPKFWALDHQRGLVTDRQWQLDFAVGDESAGTNAPAVDRPDSKVRVTLAAEPDTTAVCGTWGSKLGERIKAPMDELGMLIVRRSGVRSTVFAAAHEPYTEGARPEVAAVTVLARSDAAMVVRVDGADFTDYAAVEWQPREGASPVAVGAGREQVAFRNYAWLRIRADGTAVSRGHWEHLRVRARGLERLNGQPAPVASGFLVIGRPLSGVAQAAEPRDTSDPFDVRLDPPDTRIDPTGSVRMTLVNVSRKPVTGSVELDLPAGLSLEGPTGFGPIAPHASAAVTVPLRAGAQAPAGMKRITYRFRYAVDGGDPQTTPYRVLPVSIGPTLCPDYSLREDPRFRILAGHYTAEVMMQHGLLVKLTGPDGTAVLDGQPLFTIADQGKALLHRDQKSSYVWVRTAPAWFKAHLDNLVYYTTTCLTNRMRVGVDREWNKLKDMRFALPGLYTAPGGKPTWKRIIAVDEAGQEFDAEPGAAVKVAAAELELPGLPYSLAFEFHPPVAVDFDGPAMSFTFDGFSDNGWSFGFCRVGQLAEWRGKQ
ncbi:MAG: hypothetical protein WCS01_05440 [bacterium]